MTASTHSLPVVDTVVIIFGDSTGIIAAIARQLLKEGYWLSLGLHQPDTVRDSYADASDRVLATRFDATVPDNASAWLDRTLERFDGVDVLVNNAGLLKPLSFWDSGELALGKTFSVNANAPFRMIRACLPHLARCVPGRSVNIASTIAKRYRETVSIAYAALKNALLTVLPATIFERWEACIRVTAVCPGTV
jgi:NAD(P)-dependent dehydrogenase (short-subunit alcohol dehydrogenase family)